MELLVVIGIIAMLISILMPELSKARESARAIQCASNLKNIGAAVQQYCQDNRGYYPDYGQFDYYTGAYAGYTIYSWVGRAGTGGGSYTSLTALDRPLNKYLIANLSARSPVPIASCPSDDIYGPNSQYQVFGSSYGADYWGLVNPVQPPGLPSGCYVMINQSQVIRPTRLVVMSEQYADNYVTQPYGTWTNTENGGIFPLVEHYIPTTPSVGQWNLLFADGHVDAPILKGYNTGQVDSNSFNGVLTNGEGADYSFIND